MSGFDLDLLDEDDADILKDFGKDGFVCDPGIGLTVIDVGEFYRRLSDDRQYSGLSILGIDLTGCQPIPQSSQAVQVLFQSKKPNLADILPGLSLCGYINELGLLLVFIPAVSEYSEVEEIIGKLIDKLDGIGAPIKIGAVTCGHSPGNGFTLLDFLQWMFPAIQLAGQNPFGYHITADIARGG